MVRYTTNGAIFANSTAALADQTFSKWVRYYGRCDFLVIGQLGFDRVERDASAQAASLLYKIIDTRRSHRSTALVTNIVFDAWGDYLGDPPLPIAVPRILRPAPPYWPSAGRQSGDFRPPSTTVGT
jgi:hypothetical protein